MKPSSIEISWSVRRHGHPGVLSDVLSQYTQTTSETPSVVCGWRLRSCTEGGPTRVGQTRRAIAAFGGLGGVAIPYAESRMASGGHLSSVVEQCFRKA